MVDNEPSQELPRKRGPLDHVKQTVGSHIARGLMAFSLARNPQPVSSIDYNTQDISTVKPTVTLVEDTHSRSTEQQQDFNSKISRIIQNEFPDQYQNLESRGKDPQLKELVQSLARESQNEDEAKIFARMTGKFLEKNFLNFTESTDTTSITPELVRVQRMLLERYKEKVPVYGFSDVSDVAQDPDTTQPLYAFQDVFTVLRTYRNEFDPKTETLSDKGEELHTINAIDVMGSLFIGSGSGKINMDISSYALVYATMAAEGIGDVDKTGLDLNMLQNKTRFLTLSVDSSLSYVDRSLSAIKIAKIGAAFLKTYPTIINNSDFSVIELFSSEIRDIVKNTKSPSEAYIKAEQIAKEYAHFLTPDFINLRRSQNQIPPEIRNQNPSTPIDFARVPEILEARKIIDPQERLKKIISILSVVTSDKTPHPRYQYQVEGADIAACNIYSTDLLQGILGQEVISHRIDTSGKPVGSGGQELNAEGMYEWIKKHGAEYGWEDVTLLSYDEKKELLAAGFIFFGANTGHNWVIGMVDDKPVLSQATYDVDFMYVSPNNYKINGTDGVIYAHRIPN
jgi:hypothetical protein